VKAATSAASLLLQAVIVPGEKSHEERLIEAVTLPWFDIVKQLEADPTLAFRIPAQKREEIIAGA
jgi:restriction system protein